MFPPVPRDGRWLVNPVPVNLCRALGAELVIAVDLCGAARTPSKPAAAEETQPAVVCARTREPGAESPPGLAWVVQRALEIMQIRVGRSRLAGDPPDLRLVPRVHQIQPLEFAGGEGTIEEGRRVVRRMMPAIADLLCLERSG